MSARYGDDARFVAGGAMMTILLRQRLVAPRYLISLTDIPDLSGTRRHPLGLRLGATTTLRAIEKSAEVRAAFPVLSDAARLVGNVRVRNVATIGGHLAQADVHLDLPPVLSALGASVVVFGPSGGRRVNIDELLVGYYETSLAPGEVITAVDLSTPPPALTGVYLKYCSLSPNDWPTVGVAALLQPQDGRATDVRIVVGSVSERPLRLPDAEALLQEGPLTTATIAEVGQRYAAATDPLPDVRGSVDYKRHVTGVFVQRAITQAAAKAGLSLDS
jgi:carbon-monoxide dehydrogenase medium subunit